MPNHVRQEDMMRELARNFLNTQRNMAQDRNATEIIKRSWKFIKFCLGASTDTLSPLQIETWEIAFLTYMSEKAEFKDIALEERWPRTVLSEQLRTAIGLITLGEHTQSTQPTASPIQPGRKQMKHTFSLNRRARVALTALILWAAYVTVRASSGFQFLGASFYQWNANYFFLNLLAPPVAIAGTILIHKWIKKGAIK